MTIDYTRHYMKWHSESKEHLDYQVLYYKKRLGKIVSGKKGGQVLDIGCGMGFAMLALRELGFQDIQGIEIDEGQAASCLQKGLSVQKVDDSLQFIKNYSGSFDVVLMLDVIEHMKPEDQLLFLTEVVKKINQEGIFICTVPNANSSIAATWRYIDWTHHTSFTEHSIDFLLYNAGFTEIEVKEIEFVERPGVKNLIKGFWRKAIWKQLSHWLLFKINRKFQRLKFIAELGWDQGKKVPLSLNLLVVATKK